LGIGGLGGSGMRRIEWVEIDVPEAEMATKLRPKLLERHEYENFHASLAIDYC